MSAAEPVRALHIAVGIIKDERGRVLISQRRPGTEGQGQWEFPGGKREPNESVPDALRRELAEELGITVTGARPFITVHHDYPNRRVFLDTWLVTGWQGEVMSLEGQVLAWVAPEKLGDWQLLEADVPIVHALRLPGLYLFTGEADYPDQLVARLRRSLERGVRLVRLRAPGLGDQAYEALAARCLPVCGAFGAQLLLDRSADMVARVAAHGLHVASRSLLTLRERPVSRDCWFAASCHDLSEIALAERLGADFAVLGPVHATPSHPAAVPLGWERFAELAAGASIPVYALGGLASPDLDAAWQHGARGVAAIRSLWGDA